MKDTYRGLIIDWNHALECIACLESRRRSNEVREYESRTAPIFSPALVIGLAAGTTYSTEVQKSQTLHQIRGVIRHHLQ
jgi:hypothetical protein